MRKLYFTAVPNEVIDTHMRELSGAEVKVLLVILRSTFGWHRETKALSLARIAELAGLSSGSCSDAPTASLAVKNLIVKHRQTTEKGGYGSTVYEPAFDASPYSTDREGSSTDREAPSRQAESYKEEIKQEERKETIPPTPSFEENPPSNTPQEIISELNSRKGFRCSAGQRKSITEGVTEKIAQMPLAEAADHFQALFESGHRVFSRPTKPSGFPMRAIRTFGTPIVTTIADWISDPKFMQFREDYTRINPATIDNDWHRTWLVWPSLSAEEQDRAITRLPEYQGAWIKQPYNYIGQREFERQARPQPKTKLEITMENC